MRYLFQILLTVMVVTGSSVSEAKDLYYCPMHPSYQSDKPGSCPICHMSLVKKAVAADPNQNKGAKAVHLNEHQQELLGIATVPVKMMPLKKIIRTGGYVNTMHDIFNTQDEYIKAYTNYVNAFRDQKRFAHTRRNWAANREVQLNLHAAEDKLLRLGLNHDEIQKLQKFSWRTPWQEAGLSFFNEDQHYWVTAQFYEQDLGYLAVGQDVRVEIPAYHETMPGKIKTIGQILDPETRTVNALIEIPIYRGELVGNMFANVQVDVELNDYLMVPQEALMDTGTRKVVFVKESSNQFTPREVVVGALGDNGWGIKSGIKVGDQVVVAGNFLLDSESKMQATLDGGHDHD